MVSALQPTWLIEHMQGLADMTRLFLQLNVLYGSRLDMKKNKMKLRPT